MGRVDRWVMVVVLASSWWFGGRIVSAEETEHIDSNGLLFVVQDTASIERQIATYIHAHHGIQAKIHESTKNPGDIFLAYKIGGKDGYAELNIYVDTLVSSRSKETQAVTERLIKVSAYFNGARKCASEASCRHRLLELHNRFSARYWMPHQVYLDKDNDVAFGAFVNITGGIPVHVEQVHDLLVRMSAAWRDYNKMVTEEFGSLP
jgi:hypothetical protein